MKEIREFWSNIENLRHATMEAIQSDVLAYLDLLTEKDATIENLREQVMLESKLYVALKGDFYTIKRENTRLRKALEEARGQIESGGTHPEVLLRMIKIIDAALGEGDKSE